MREWAVIQVFGVIFWGEMERKSAMAMGDGYCSLASSIISGSLTPGFHTRVFISTPGNVEADG